MGHNCRKPHLKGVRGTCWRRRAACCWGGFSRRPSQGNGCGGRSTGIKCASSYCRRAGPCNYTLSEWAQQRVRVLCLAAVGGGGGGAGLVWETWGRRCDHLLFLAPQPHPVVPTLVVNASEGAWSQTWRALEFILRQTDWRYDWILKADDKAFVVVENLRQLLFTRTRTGALFTSSVTADEGLRSTAAYVISREAALQLATRGHRHPACRDTAGEGATVVQCLSAVGAQFFVMKDSVHLPVFYELPPEALMKDVLRGNRMDECCSAHPVLFHGLSLGEMRAAHYLLYRLKHYPHIPCVGES